MFQFPAFAHFGDGLLDRRVAPFGDPRVSAYVQLTVAYRSSSRPSSPPDAKASTMCPSFLVRRSRIHKSPASPEGFADDVSSRHGRRVDPQVHTADTQSRPRVAPVHATSTAVKTVKEDSKQTPFVLLTFYRLPNCQ